MDVQVWVFGSGKQGARQMAAWRMSQLKHVAFETERNGRPALVVAVEPGRESEVERELRLWDGELATTEQIVDGGAVVQELRKRREATPVAVPFEREQVGVRVVLEDGAVVDVDQGLTFEVSTGDHLTVRRGQRGVAVYRAGTWRSAERMFVQAETPDL